MGTRMLGFELELIVLWHSESKVKEKVRAHREVDIICRYRQGVCTVVQGKKSQKDSERIEMEGSR